MLNVLITGANRGIGLAITELALKRGDKVVAICRHPSSAKELIALREGYLDKCEIVSLDVVNEDSMHDAALKIKEHLDLLVCNAGVRNGYGGMMSAENTMDAFRDVLMTNVASPFLPRGISCLILGIASLVPR